MRVNDIGEVKPRLRNGATIASLLLVSSLAGAAEQVADTQFTQKRGFYSSPFTVVMTSKTQDSLIHYTTDGSLPGSDHGKGGENPVAVDISTTTVLRAVAYAPGMRPSNVDTQTYIFIEDVIRQPKHIPGYPNPRLPCGRQITASGWHWPSVRLDYEMDPEIVRGPTHREDIYRGLKSIPTLSLALDKEHMFGSGGIYFASQGQGPTHPGSGEFIDPDDPGRSFQVDCAIESHATAGLKRSLKLKFKKEFGPGKLETTFFRDHAVVNGDSAPERLDRIVLRSGNDHSFAISFYPRTTTYARDQWVRDTQIAMSGAGSHGTFVHLYINGLYWGLYNACERPDAWFTSTTFGGKKEEWFAVNQWGPFQGDPARWDYLRGPLKDKDLRDPQNYHEIQEYLDLERFADYLILAFMAGTASWPLRNWYGGNRNDPATPFRFFVWDAELSWMGIRRSDGARRLPDVPWTIQKPFRSSEDAGSKTMVGIWHALRKNPEFMTVFADRVYKHCFHGGALTDDRSIGRWRALNAFIEDAVVAESARWGDALKELGVTTRTRDNTFYPEVERVVQMMEGSVERFIAALRREGYYPRLDPPRFDVARPGFLSAPAIALRNPNSRGRVLFTVNGSDPRAAGGTASADARGGQGLESVMLAGPRTIIKARVKAGAKWSALHERAFCYDAARLNLWERLWPLPKSPEQDPYVCPEAPSLSG